MILQSGPNDLLAVEEVLGPDEANHRVHKQRFELPCNGIGARFHRLLIDAEMSIRRESCALTGLEIHQVCPDWTAPEAANGIVRLLEQRKTDAESFVGLL